MKVIQKVAEISAWISKQKQAGKSVGFVPTMGALHQGHISLVKRAKQENDICVVSVFVNPTQFNNKEDLEKYPRNYNADATLLSEFGCDVAFFPEVEGIYPEGEKSLKFNFNGLESEMEGKFRPGHFDGVATVVSRFFDIIQPNKAYFGEKDFQQLRIIQTLAEQNYPTLKIVPMPIFREEDGLAMSSRNQRLTPEFRAESPKIYKLLSQVKTWQKEGYSIEEVKNKVDDFFKETTLKLEYFSLCDEQTLKEVTSWAEGNNIRAFLAVYAGEIRLIDNMRII